MIIETTSGIFSLFVLRTSLRPFDVAQGRAVAASRLLFLARLKSGPSGSWFATKSTTDRALRDRPTLATMKPSRRWGTQI
jgi:hypothetical protein